MTQHIPQNFKKGKLFKRRPNCKEAFGADEESVCISGCCICRAYISESVYAFMNRNFYSYKTHCMKRAAVEKFSLCVTSAKEYVHLCAYVCLCMGYSHSPSPICIKLKFNHFGIFPREAGPIAH